MSDITLARALKIKNILTGKLAKIQSEIQLNNSVISDTEQSDIRQLLALRNEIVRGILELKEEINEKNSEIQGTIYELGEAKSSLQFWNGITTLDGNAGDVHYGTSNPIIRTAVIKTAEKNGVIAELESKIEAMQEKLDVHNHSTKLSVSKETLIAAGVRS